MVFKKNKKYSSTKELRKKKVSKKVSTSLLYKLLEKNQQRSRSGELLKKLGGLNFQNLATEFSVVEIFRNLKMDPTPNSTPPVSFWPGLHAARPCRTELEEVNGAGVTWRSRFSQIGFKNLNQILYKKTCFKLHAENLRKWWKEFVASVCTPILYAKMRRKMRYQNYASPACFGVEPRSFQGMDQA